jgi:hypothetical protein
MNFRQLANSPFPRSGSQLAEIFKNPRQTKDINFSFTTPGGPAFLPRKANPPLSASLENPPSEIAAPARHA